MKAKSEKNIEKLIKLLEAKTEKIPEINFILERSKIIAQINSIKKEDWKYTSFEDGTIILEKEENENIKIIE